MNTIPVAGVRRTISDYAINTLNGRPGRTIGGRKIAGFYTIPTPGGPIQLETFIRPRYSTIAIDRIIGAHALPDEPEYRDWYEANLWPVVRRALQARSRSHWAILPSPGLYTHVGPVLTSEVLEALHLVMGQELEWQAELNDSTPERTPL